LFLTSEKKKVRGIYVLILVLIRGFDLKFSLDAFFMIFNTIENGLDLTKVRQMLGRGSRSQGASLELSILEMLVKCLRTLRTTCAKKKKIFIAAI
jgi:hypothetical protein